MKKLLVIAFMIVGSAAFAQVNGAPTQNTIAVNNAKMIEVQSQQMKTDLGLNDGQTTQINAWLTKQEQDREAIRAEVKGMRANGQQLTEAQKSVIKAKLDAQRTAVETELKKILSPQQYALWQNKMEATTEQFQKSAPKAAKAG